MKQIIKSNVTNQILNLTLYQMVTWVMSKILTKKLLKPLVLKETFKEALNKLSSQLMKVTHNHTNTKVITNLFLYVAYFLYLRFIDLQRHILAALTPYSQHQGTPQCRKHSPLNITFPQLCFRCQRKKIQRL